MLRNVVIWLFLCLFLSSISNAQDVSSNCDALGVPGSYNGFFFDSFKSTGSDSEGAIAAANLVDINHYSVGLKLNIQDSDYAIVSGGDVVFPSGKLEYGSIIAANSANVGDAVSNAFSGAQSVDENGVLPFSFDDVKQDITTLSTQLSSIDSNGEVELKWGGVYIEGDAASSLQVFNIDGQALLDAHSININNIPSDATIVFNVSGATAGLQYMGLQSLSAWKTTTLFNFFEAELLTLRGVGVYGSILAPHAQLNRPEGVIHGSLIAESFDGQMQLNHVPFQGCFELQSDNTPPIAGSQSVELLEDTSIAISLSASDAENDALSYELVDSPSRGVLLGDSPNFIYTPEPNANGQDNLTFRVFDGSDYSDLATVTISVIAVDDTPTITSDPITQVLEDSTYTYQVSAQDNDIGEILVFSLVSSPVGMSIDPQSGRISWLPAQQDVGLSEVNVEVADGNGNTANQVFTVNVSNVNDLPIVENIDDVTVEADTSVNISIAASDEDADTLSYSILSGPVGATIDNLLGVFSWTPNGEQVGIHPVVISVEDGTGSAQVSFAIEVTPTAVLPPSFVGNANFIGFVGEVFTSTIEVASEEAYTLSVLSGPEGLSISDSGDEIIWPAPIAGTYSFDLKAEVNSELSTTQTFSINIVERESSHEGSDFWLAFGSNLSNGADFRNQLLYISSEVDNSGVVSLPLKNINIPFTLSAGEVISIEIPVEYRVSDADKNNQAKGIHVTSEKNIVLYALNQERFSTDGFLVYPTETLGTRYRPMTYDAGLVYYVATQDNTTVDFKFSNEAILTRSGCLLCVSEKYEAGDVLTTLMQAGEVYSFSIIRGTGTLSDDLIVADKPVAVFSGDKCNNVPSSVRACDHLVEQMPPTAYWGSAHYVTTLAKRFGGDTIRIVADFDGTEIYVNGDKLATLDESEWVEDTITEPSFIETNHPVLMAQFAKGSTVDFDENGSFGDPSMMLIAPTEQYVSDYRFTTTDRGIEFNYANVVIETSAISTLMLNGNVVSPDLFEQIRSTHYSAAQIPLNEGTHQIQADIPFGLTVYGFGESDSYGYQGGISLPRYNDQQTLSISKHSASATVGQETCITATISDTQNRPLINARVDVRSQNSVRPLSHINTNEFGQAEYCYTGMSVLNDTISFTSNTLFAETQVSWIAAEDGIDYSPRIVSLPVVHAGINREYLYNIQAIDSNLSEALSYQLIEYPTGMSITDTRIQWSPTIDDLGLHDVKVSVVDEVGNRTEQVFVLEAVSVNRPPELKLLRLDESIIYIGRTFNNQLVISDPDRDVVYCHFIGPEYPELGYRNNDPCLISMIATKPYTVEDIGTKTERIRAYDRSGGETIFEYTVTIRDNVAPVFASVATQYIRAGEAFSLDLDATDGDGDDITFIVDRVTDLNTGNRVQLNDQSIASDTGVFSFTPFNTETGEYRVSFRARDEVSEDVLNVNIVVSRDDQPFVAQMNLPSQVLSQGTPLVISPSVNGASGEVSYILLLDGQAVLPDDDGSFTIDTTDKTGILQLELSVQDSSGQSFSISERVAIANGSDTVSPEVSLAAISSDVTSPTDILATIRDDNLLSWQLSLVRQQSEEAPQILVEGEQTSDNAVIHTFDPSTLVNGLYQLELSAIDTSGLESVDVISILVDGQLKLGNFTYAVTDAVVNMAGLPLEIRRVYDSRRKAQVGDFGHGWHLDYNLIELQSSRPIASGWQLNEYATGPLGILREYCVEPIGDITVSVTLPNDDVERFKLSASPECNENTPVLDVVLQFTPQGDTQSSLSLKSTPTLRLVGDELQIFGTGQAFDEADYILTTRGGYEYEFSGKGDIQRLSDPNGHEITFEETGIIHSNGFSATYTRDDQGKITQITLPSGKKLPYTYDNNQDLTRGAIATPFFNDLEYYTYDYLHGLLTITDSDDNRKVFNVYDDKGQLIAQEDSDGNLTSFEHDVDGRQSVISDRNGHISLYYYDERGNVTSMVDPLGHITQYEYDDNDNIVLHTDALGFTTTSLYNVSNDLLSQTNPLGHVTTYTYNDLGQQTSVTDAKGNTSRLTYDAVGNMLGFTDNLGHATTNDIDGSGFLTSMTDALGGIKQYEYDIRGNVLAETDETGAVREFTYDLDDRLLSSSLSRTVRTISIDEDGVRTIESTEVTDTKTMQYFGRQRIERTDDGIGVVRQATFDRRHNIISDRDAGITSNFTYDAYNRVIAEEYNQIESTKQYDPEGNLISETDRNGNVTQYEYDALNRLARTIYADGGEAQMVYDALGQLIEEIDTLGNKTLYTYDGTGRQTSMTDALGNEYSYAYDANDNRTSMTDPLGRITQYEYDANDRLVKTVYSDDTSISQAYDALGRRISITDQNGSSTEYKYDGVGRLIEVIDPLVQSTRYEYDEAGNKIAQIDALGRQTDWLYDERGRVTARILPMGQQETFTYNNTNEVRSYTDFNGEVSNYGYWQSTPWLNTRVGAHTETYRYDSHGNQLASKNDAGEFLRAYDAMHRLIEEQQPSGAVLVYDYDTQGNRLSVVTTLPNDEAGDEAEAALYTYDALNRLSSVTDATGGITRYEYDAVGNQTHIHYPNGLVSETEYDALNRKTAVSTKDADGNVLSRYAYSLDNTGRVLSITEDSGRVSTFTYDTLYRLSTESISSPNAPDYSASYAYDAVGNRISREENGLVNTYLYDANDRLLSDGTYTYTYNPQGSLLTKTDTTQTQSVSYVYDGDHRLSQFSDGTSTVDYTYTTEGIRLSKAINGEQIDYVVDSNRDYAQVIVELDDAGELTKQYVHGADLISQQGNEDKHYYHYDALGTTRSLSDALASMSDNYEYSAFGDMLNTSGNTDNNYLYTGEQFDAELDNYYLRARYYDQGVGRFTQMDTFDGWDEEPLSLNKFNYVHSDPINGIDPSGNMLLAQMTTAQKGLTIMAVSSAAAIQFGQSLSTSANSYNSDVNEGLIILLAGANNALFNLVFREDGESNKQKIEAINAAPIEEKGSGDYKVFTRCHVKRGGTGESIGFVEGVGFGNTLRQAVTNAQASANARCVSGTQARHCKPRQCWKGRALIQCPRGNN